MPDRAACQIVTGAEYVKQITALESDRRARAAFWDLVLRIAPPGAALLDFGAGTGIDARFYAEHGFAVTAYDVDPKMCEFFARHCRDYIDAGRITLDTGSYQQFLDRKSARAGGDIDLVTSNFAPLNLVDDLHGLFAGFHALTSPTGKVLASVLSPYFIGDIRYRWWWRNALRLWRYGRFSVAGAQAPIVRRRLADFASQCSPYFTLTRVIPGLPPTREANASGIAGEALGRYTWARLLSCRFMFLFFEKRNLQEQDNPL